MLGAGFADGEEIAVAGEHDRAVAPGQKTGTLAPDHPGTTRRLVALGAGAAAAGAGLLLWRRLLR